MKKTLLYLQAIILIGGSVFAWITVFGDFVRFFSNNGLLMPLYGYSPNPLTTPCFYGAIVFLVALIWSILILLAADRSKNVKSQKHLMWLLFSGTIFAWGNFAYQMYKYYTPHTGIYIGCSGIPLKHPIYTPCFTGAVVFLIAFILSFISFRTLTLTKK
jgi:hypothetical protein